MATRKKRPVNYLNNANLMEQIRLSKAKLAEAQKKDETVTPASCMTNELVKMLMMLVDRYSKKANWRGYTYIEDMRSEALVSLMNGALKFDPEVGQNPFGYYTQIVHHSFLTTLDKEKKVRRIRDDLLEQNGFNPSNTRQLENESVRMERIEREFYEDQENEED